MPTIIKKTTVVTTVRVVREGDATTQTTETVTSISDGDEKDAAKAAEIEQAVKDSTAAMDELFDGFGAKMDAVFDPLRKILR